MSSVISTLRWKVISQLNFITVLPDMSIRIQIMHCFQIVLISWRKNKEVCLYASNASIDVHFVIHSFGTNETLPQKALKHETIDKNDFYDPFYSIHDQSLCCKLLTLMRMVLIGLYALCFSKAYNCYLYLGQKVSSIHMRTCVSFWNDLQSFFG